MRSPEPGNPTVRSAICALAVAAQLLIVPLNGLHHHEHQHEHDHHEPRTAYLQAEAHASADCATCALINQSRIGFDVAPRIVAVAARASTCPIRPAAQPPAASPNRIACPRAPPLA